MSQFTIITKGVGACYIKDDAWKILFPFDTCHTVKLGFGVNGEEPDTGTSFGGKGVRIDVSVTDPLTRTAKGSDFDNFLDLTGSGAHADITTKGELEDMNAVLVSLGNAVLGVKEHTPESFRLIDRDETRVTSTTFQKTGDSGQIFIEGGVLTIQVTGLGTSHTLTFSEDTTIIIDNDCLEAPANIEFGDMDMLYDILADGVEEDRKLKMEKEKAPASATTLPQSVGVAMNGTVSEVAVLSPLESPTSGLPCNMFHISKTLRLPS